MKRTTYQVPELRDENDNIIQQGAFGKNTALANSTNDGWIDYVANDLEALHDAQTAAGNAITTGTLTVTGKTTTGTLDAGDTTVSGSITTTGLTVTGTTSVPTANAGNSSKAIANTEYVQAELQNYLPLSGGTLTGVVNGVTPPNGDNSKKLATTEFVTATAQQADWNATDTSSKAYVKNKPTNLSVIGNTPQFRLNKLSKEDNGGNPVYFLMHELVKYSPDAHMLTAGNYGFNGMVFGYPRNGNGGSQFLAIVKVGLGFEYNDLYSSSGHYSPVVIKDETNNKYYWAMEIKGSYQGVYMLGAFTANPLNTVISAVDRAGTLPEGWSLVHTAKLYPFDNTHVASADKDGQGNTIASTYLPAVVGAVVAFAGSITPQGWLLCDGSAVSRTYYAALFAVIGTTYGAGNGSTTFNLPNLVDKFVEGSATAGTVKSAGLPNITGNTDGAVTGQGFVNNKGNKALFVSQTGGSGAWQKVSSTDRNSDRSIGFDASRSSAIYGNSTTVQPPALTMRYIIKY